MAFSEDLSVFFADFGVPVIFGGVVTRGNLDTPTSDFDMGAGASGMESRQYRVTVAASVFPVPPKAKDAITVNGVAYTVRKRCYMGDGALMELELSK